MKWHMNMPSIVPRPRFITGSTGLLLLLPMLLLSWSGCQKPLADSLVAAARQGAPAWVSIYFAKCPGDRVNELVVMQLEGPRGHKTSTAIWKVQYRAPGELGGSTSFRVVSYELGRTPPDFEEVIPLSRSIEARSSLGVVITARTSAGNVYESILFFSYSELPEQGRVLTRDGVRDLGAFEKSLVGRCGKS